MVATGSPGPPLESRAWPSASRDVALPGTVVDLEVPQGRRLGLLARTERARPLSSASWPRCSRRRGRAEVLGHDVVREPAAVRELIGLTGQFAAVDEILSGRENLEMFAGSSTSPATRPGAGGDLSSALISRTPPTARRGRTPAACAAARPRLEPAHTPPVLFLDEPTTGLDPAQPPIRSGDRARAEARGTTLLLTTQYRGGRRARRSDRGHRPRTSHRAGTGNELKIRRWADPRGRMVDAAQRDKAQAVLAGVGCGEPSRTSAPTPELPAPRDGLELVRRRRRSSGGRGSP